MFVDRHQKIGLVRGASLLFPTFSHAAGLGGLLMALSAGEAVVFLEKFDLDVFLRAIVDRKVAIMISDNIIQWVVSFLR